MRILAYKSGGSQHPRPNPFLDSDQDEDSDENYDGDDDPSEFDTDWGVYVRRADDGGDSDPDEEENVNPGILYITMSGSVLAYTDYGALCVRHGHSGGE